MASKKQLKELFTFSNSERKGIIILSILLILVIIANSTVSYFFDDQAEDTSQFQKEITEFEANLTQRKEGTYLSRLDKFIIARYDTIKLYKFNPNNLAAQEWQKLGFTEKQQKTITNYLDKGGKFYDRDDFRKIYGIRRKQFEIIEPYLDLPEKSNYPQRFSRSKYYKKDNYNKYEKITYQPDSLFNFDPNTASISDWKHLGFSEKQAKSIGNYLSKGGKFYKKEDLKKIYTVKEEQYLAVADFIQIKKTGNPKEGKTYEKKTDTSNIVVYLNEFSLEEFINLGGFWKYNAKKIVSFRTQAGGFLYKEQLLDLWGMKKKYYDNIKQKIVINTSKIDKIRVNFADKKEFATHPYLSFSQARQIIEFRDKHGFIKDINLLRTRKVLSKTTFNKIKPYLTVK